MNQPDGPAMNRAARRRAARGARAAGGPSPRRSSLQNANRAGEPHFMTINHGPDRRNVSCRKITETIANPLTKTVTLNSTAVEDTIHPVSRAIQQASADGYAVALNDHWRRYSHIDPGLGRSVHRDRTARRRHSALPTQRAHTNDRGLTRADRRIGDAGGISRRRQAG
jgi:hypothetical protein